MKVAYLVNQYPKTSHTFVRRELLALEAQGVEVRRFAIRAVDEPLVHALDVQEQGRTETLLAHGPVRIALDTLATAARHPLRFARALALAARVGWRSDRGLLIHTVYLAEACTLLRALQLAPVEHVHAHFAANPTAVAMLCQRLGGPPFSFTAHGSSCFESPDGIGLRTKLGLARFAVAVCEYGAAELRRAARPADAMRVHVVRCGPEPDWIDAPARPIDATPRLVCVSRLSAEKGADVLIEALDRLHREDVDFELEWVGDGPERAMIESELERRGLQDKVFLAGWRDGAAVAESILRARALVLSSRAEGLPVVLLEAFALRRPAVGTDVGGVAEILRNGETGWLVPSGDPRALAEGLRAALRATPEELDQMGQRGARAVAERHDPRREAARLAHLMRGSSAPDGGPLS